MLPVSGAHVEDTEDGSDQKSNCESISCHAESERSFERAGERKASERRGRKVSTWKIGGIGRSVGSMVDLSTYVQARGLSEKNLRWCVDDLNLVSSCNLANSSSPKFVELILVESLGALATDSRLKFVFKNRRGVALLSILSNKLSTLKLSSSLSEFLNGLVRHSLDATRLLTIRLAGRRKGNQTS
ncbi:hypothetical protein HG530_004677 [Fusarium avenaceum]|nr:hypothetical protein HG530_004677 [Fusarium avenaceum]